MRNVYQKALIFVGIYAICLVGSVSGNSQPTERSVAASKIIVTVMDGRIRSEPSLRGKILKEAKVGTVLSLVEENSKWHKVELSPANEAEGTEAEMGWIAKSISSKFDEAKPDPVFKQIANNYLGRKKLSLRNTNGLMEFLESAADNSKTFETGGMLRLQRLHALQKALRNIPVGKGDNPPYKSFLEKHKEEVVYSEPAGEWYVRANNYWELHARYKKHKVGQDIAWEASNASLPGECEGYVVCHINKIRVTSGEYLNFYPNGKHSKQALTDIINLLQPIVADIPRKTTYYTASDISDRAVFNKILAELRTIISKTPYIEKQKALVQISQIAEGHR
ncbi:MAG: hypothetical protein HKN25_05620 [Pyrinomonadaceae bacterium]|nr:hypothetical protein [Pyrinomonadaceae bacterium]